MRLRRLTVSITVCAMLSALVEAQSEPVDEAKSAQEAKSAGVPLSWPPTPKPTFVQSGCTMSAQWTPQGISEWYRGLYSNTVDPDCFSSKNTKLTYAVTVSEDGIPTQSLIKSENATAADRFYCDQVFWEHRGIICEAPKFSGTKCTVEFGSAVYKATEDRFLVGGIAPGVVTLHVVPAFAIAKCREFGGSDFNGPANLARIEVQKLTDPELEQFREEWINLVAHTSEKPTRAQLWQISKEMRVKYKNLFGDHLPSLHLTGQQIRLLSEGTQFRTGVFLRSPVYGKECADGLAVLNKNGLVQFYTEPNSDQPDDRLVGDSELMDFLDDLAKGPDGPEKSKTGLTRLFYAATENGKRTYYGDPSVWQYYLDAQVSTQPKQSAETKSNNNAEPSKTIATPDSGSPEPVAAWDLWHTRVENAIRDRFNFFAKAAFRRSPPLKAAVSYTITADGHISDVLLDEKSSSALFDTLVYQAVKSVDGDKELLRFPCGSQRKSVRQSYTFTKSHTLEEEIRARHGSNWAYEPEARYYFLHNR